MPVVLLVSHRNNQAETAAWSHTFFLKMHGNVQYIMEVYMDSQKLDAILCKICSYPRLCFCPKMVSVAIS